MPSGTDVSVESEEASGLKGLRLSRCSTCAAAAPLGATGNTARCRESRTGNDDSGEDSCADSSASIIRRFCRVNFGGELEYRNCESSVIARTGLKSAYDLEPDGGFKLGT